MYFIWNKNIVYVMSIIVYDKDVGWKQVMGSSEAALQRCS